jgi:hypothetical protein
MTSHHDELGGLTDGDRELILRRMQEMANEMHDLADRLSERPSTFEVTSPTGWKAQAKGPSWLLMVISGLAAGSFITWTLPKVLEYFMH